MPFNIESPVGEVSKQHLQQYQAGEAVGYTIECKDGSFQVHKWCLYNSDFLLSMHNGTVKIFDFKMIALKSQNFPIFNHLKFAKILEAKTGRLSIWKNFEKYQFE